MKMTILTFIFDFLYFIETLPNRFCKHCFLCGKRYLIENDEWFYEDDCKINMHVSCNKFIFHEHNPEQYLLPYDKTLSKHASEIHKKSRLGS